ncbi:T9SS type A sorting domain-containing protein [Altibacter sp.]|uniref:T9SS type A sorting domain-containing protein n=1 Tax=Altibacter sp. TaxID=2024823 RepID=UPI000C983341|nr:T9SS type A sorting domain-containing protein [Altibacter sp.]MAP56004.1 hypothetical protein [Altibacter sp.]
MKIYYFISFCLFCSTIFCQSYTPLLNNINEWQVTNCFNGCLTDTYYTDGDTIVEGKSYKILDGFHYISRTFLLREELSTKKIYLAKLSLNRIDEYLLYDFGLNEGDSFNMMNPISPFPQDGGAFILDSVRWKPLIDGNNYRHYYFSPAPTNPTSSNNAVWIEGVGSLSLINAPGGDPNVNGVGHLSCFFKNSELFYANLDSISGCSPVLSVPEVSLLDSLKFITSEGACIVANARSVVRIDVFDLSGQRIDSIFSSNKERIQIDVSHYAEGFYLFIVSTETEKRTFKVILN